MAASSLRQVAKARTGNVDMPATLGGTALNVAPVGGRAESAVRCSTTGISRSSRSVCTCRSPPRVSSMLTESMPDQRDTLVGQPLGGLGGQERVLGRAVGLGAEVQVPAGAHQHGVAGDVEALERRQTGGAGRFALDDQRGEQGAPLERQPAEVVPTAVPVARRVEVGPVLETISIRPMENSVPSSYTAWEASNERWSEITDR